MSCLAGGVNWTEAESSSDESVAMIDRCYYISAHCCRSRAQSIIVGRRCHDNGPPAAAAGHDQTTRETGIQRSLGAGAGAGARRQ